MEEMRASYDFKKLLDFYLVSLKLPPWSRDPQNNEFGLEDYEDLGPELLLNLKYLDWYRSPGTQPYLYHNLS